MSIATKPRSRKKVPDLGHKVSARRAVTHPNRRVDHPGAIENIDLSTMGGRISWARMRRSMTQKDLAEMIDKSRVSVVQYEQDNIEPPFSVIDLMAKKLDVSPAYLAFGQHGIDGVINAEDEILSIEEITFGRDGEYVSSAMALPKTLVGDMTDAVGRIAAYVLPIDAPEFGYLTGDRVFVDQTIKTIEISRDVYIVRAGNSIDILRIESSFSSGAKLRVVSRKGHKSTVALDELDIIGAVVGAIKRG